MICQVQGNGFPQSFKVKFLMLFCPQEFSKLLQGCLWFSACYYTVSRVVPTDLSLCDTMILCDTKLILRLIIVEKHNLMFIHSKKSHKLLNSFDCKATSYN